MRLSTSRFFPHSQSDEMNAKTVILSVVLFCLFYVLIRILGLNSLLAPTNIHYTEKIYYGNTKQKEIRWKQAPVITPDPLSDRSFDAWFNQWSPVMSKLGEIQKQAGTRMEGHIWTKDSLGFERIPQVRAYYTHVMARRFTIRRICETGFNAGHSTLMWAALFNGNINIIVFDLCNENRCDVGAREIRKYFPNVNLTIVSGDSTVTIPAYAKAHPDVKCDFFSVDGGHVGDVPRLDTYNFMPMARENSTVVLDDANVDSKYEYVKIVGQAWNHAATQKWIRPLGPCRYCFREQLQDKFDHKFCLAQYNHT